MVVALVILTFLILIAVEIILSKKKRVKESPAAVASPKPYLSAAKLRRTKGVDGRYYHPGHTWANVAEGETVSIGFDDFTRKVIGSIDAIELPQVGETLQQGGVVWRLRHGQRVLPQVSPVGGTVVEVNREIQENPSLIKYLPKNRDWVLKIEPANLKENLRNLLRGHLAERWMESVRSQFVLRFAREIGPVYQDGGELVDDIGSKLTEEEWHEVVNEFFFQSKND